MRSAKRRGRRFRCSTPAAKLARSSACAGSLELALAVRQSCWHFRTSEGLAYDSRAAAALDSIRVRGNPLVAVPPRRSRKLRSARWVSQARLASEYPKYTAVLRRLREKAQEDENYRKTFKRVADIERALFGAQDLDAPASDGSIARTSQADSSQATQLGQRLWAPCQAA
jgi:hypothetical protein